MPLKTFKGSVVEYRKLHYWVVQQLGKPQQCENCQTTERARYEWANLSGEYRKDISDWARLCSMCHKLYDNLPKHPPGEEHQCWSGDYCRKGHLRSEENTLLKKQWDIIQGKKRFYTTRICRPCQRQYVANWNAKKVKQEQDL